MNQKLKQAFYKCIEELENMTQEEFEEREESSGVKRFYEADYDNYPFLQSSQEHIERYTTHNYEFSNYSKTGYRVNTSCNASGFYSISAGGSIVITTTSAA